MAMQTIDVSKVLDRFDQLPKKYRIIATVVVLDLVFGVLSTLYVMPQHLAIKVMNEEFIARQASTKKVADELTLLQKQGPDAVVLAKQQALDGLQTTLNLINAAIDKRMKALVSPKDMLLMVNDILQDQSRIEVQSVENLSPQALLTEEEKAKKAEKESGKKEPAKKADAPKTEKTDTAMQAAVEQQKQTLFRHGIRITVKGQYPDIIAYLVRLEKIDWQIFWGDIKLVVDQYPYSKVTLDIYTLSPQVDWLGV